MGAFSFISVLSIVYSVGLSFVAPLQPSYVMEYLIGLHLAYSVTSPESVVLKSYLFSNVLSVYQPSRVYPSLERPVGWVKVASEFTCCSGTAVLQLETNVATFAFVE